MKLPTLDDDLMSPLTAREESVIMAFGMSLEGMEVAAMQVDYRKQYVETGVIFVPRIIEQPAVRQLRMISEHCLSQWRVKAASEPGAIDRHGDAHVIRHLNDPAYYDAAHRPWLVDLLDTIADPHILDVVREVFNDEVLFRCTSLFFNPLANSVDGNWHRDTQFTTPVEAEEKVKILDMAKLLHETGAPQNMQLQIALVPSDESEYVPGSHLRWDTEDEYEIRRSNDMKYNRSNLMPGAVRTHQEPGDVAAFHPYGLHRGRYHAERYRRTLMLTYTAASRRDMPLDFFNTQPWCMESGYLDGVKPHTRVFFERFIDNYRDKWLEAKQQA